MRNTRKPTEKSLPAEKSLLEKRLPSEEPPPFGRSWKILYAAVLVNLAALVVLFYLFTRIFK